MKIAIGIPTINRADLLKECLQDLEYKMPDIDYLYIVDNGPQRFIVPKLFHHKMTVHKSPTNLGVAGSWNWMMEKAFEESDIDYMIMLNDDIVLGKTLDDIKVIISNYPNDKILIGPYFWSVYILHKDIIKDVGYFDETFFPAYFEDNDFYRRCALANCGIVEDLESLVPMIMRNSQTIRKDPYLNKGSAKNKRYFVTKWGGMPGHEIFEEPFDGKDE